MQLTYAVESEVLVKAKVYTQVTIDYDPEVDDLDACISAELENMKWHDIDDYDINGIEDVLEIREKEKLED